LIKTTVRPWSASEAISHIDPDPEPELRRKEDTMDRNLNYLHLTAWKLKGWVLINMLLLLMPLLATGQTSTIATTLVSDTIYSADGSPATGSVIVSWGAFATATGLTVPTGSTSATIGAGGVLSLSLAANAGATPMGSYYTAVYHLDDGSVSREYWVVPASVGTIHLSTIRSTVLPTSVAMQTVSKAYVDTAIAVAITGHPLDTSTPFVLKTGDTMSGPLNLVGDPTASTEAADKHYVDVNITAVAAGLSQKVSLLPFATQTIAQPTGTQLQVNLLNGSEYAKQYVTGLGNNGIANAVASPDCAGGCDIKVDPGYASDEKFTASTLNSSPTSGTHIEDSRSGQRSDSYFNPVSVGIPGGDAGQSIDVVSTQNTPAVFAQTGGGAIGSYGLVITHEGLAGGSNLFPAKQETVPYFKTAYSALAVTGTYNTQGQHVLAPGTINCYGVGDCLIGSQFVTSSGGFRDEADEGAHPMDLQIVEDSIVFQGTCASGCTTGSGLLQLTPTAGPGTQGEGRFLIDMNPAKMFTSGVLTGGGTAVPSPTASFVGTAFPLSVFFSSAQPLLSQTNTLAPGTLVVAIATSGVPSDFVTNTGALSAASGVACLTDQPNENLPQNYEMANYSVVDGTHLRMTLNKVHSARATIAIGGLCGYGIEQTVDTTRGIRQVFPVVGSFSSTGLYYAGGLTPVLGTSGLTSSYLNLSLPIASIARSGNIVTVTTAGNLPADVNGLRLSVSGVADSSYNGTFAVTTTAPNALTYAESGANSSSSGGNVGIVTGGFALYPMAEVLTVYNPTTKLIDGQMALAPNTVAWAANDPVEQPHYFQQKVAADVIFVNQTTPRPLTYTRAGVDYGQNVGPGMRGWSVANSVPPTDYLGNGGTHTVPDIAYEATGPWRRTFDLQAGDESVLAVHCNSHGCGKWNSGYNLFLLDSNVGLDAIGFQPQTSSLNLNLRGTAYAFTPLAFTAGTVNATTVNATTINASTITGSVGAAQLPVFGPSGSGHAKGAVPDPGASAGASRYLREDGTWTLPAGGSGSSTSTPTAVVPAGALADYNFLQGAGVALTDNSGSGNSGTLGSGVFAPTWKLTGLAFTQQQTVSLPSAVNAAKTIFMAVYINPITTTTGPGNFYPVLMSSSIGGSGINLMYAKYGLGNKYTYAPDIYAGNAHTTQSPTLMSGFHVLCFVLGAGGGDLDHLYIDGAEISYTAQGSSFGLQSSGNYMLGSSNLGPFTNSGLEGTYYRFLGYGFPMAATAVQATSQAIQAEVAGRGVPVTPVQINGSMPQFLAAGTSINAAQGLSPSDSWVQHLSLTNQPAYGVINYGISGLTVESMDASEPNRAALLCRTNGGPSIYTLLGGDNDWGVLLYATPQSVFANIAGAVQTMKQAGCRVFVGTIISRSGNGANGASFDSFKDSLDTLILGSARSIGADGVIDFAANPLLGADGATSNTTTFQADHTHPTVAGQLLLANAASNVLNYTFGYNELNQHSITSLPYAMTAADGAVNVGGATGAGTLTLPDCTGQSGAMYRVSNPQAAFAVSVKALNASQLINGLSAATAVTVPANGVLTLRDVPNPKVVSGCHWEM
jgi:lysophospholipase L1-like esterase